MLKKQVKEQLNTLLIAYFAVKDALVETDSKTAKYNAGELVATLAKVENNLMTDSQKKLWEENVAKLKTDAENIGKTDDVEMQRIHFEGVSNALFLIISSFKANTATVYQQFCPMAFNNKGGAWLSDKKEIRNPYFGDKMLKCGSVKQEF
ncbi:MAG: DUF3347 domain-containing protein [Bacteroidetes bacterium]|nr:MAG: DUF3347 domain-containing protein [Bacteroidota bacterium]